ncbi:hypothetical protein [Salinicola avicenniae]|uniref:hypothetical protein n=1 Tax=Salinicola avicenniae TaxID=2916836 RepID=UPI002073A772|nr:MULTISPECIES: hypothetical protein [unclassified Salinicola]
MSIDSNGIAAERELTHRVSAYTGLSLTALTLRWPDSANWLWRTAGVSPQLLKLARTGVGPSDPFWHGMAGLFGFDRWQHAEALTRLPGALPPDLPLAPLPLTFLGRLDAAPLWSLPWRRAEAPSMNVALASRLGEQLACLHAAPVSGWGHPESGIESLSSWPARARAFVASHPRRQTLPSSPTWPLPTAAVWCLPDLRPDQFLVGATDWLWSDWEALVWAPLEFDLCLLELLLENASQTTAFVEAYRRRRGLPAVAAYRDGMRAIAWLMGLHGTQWSARVFAHPAWLDRF